MEMKEHAFTFAAVDAAMILGTIVYFNKKVNELESSLHEINNELKQLSTHLESSRSVRTVVQLRNRLDDQEISNDTMMTKLSELQRKVQRLDNSFADTVVRDNEPGEYISKSEGYEPTLPKKEKKEKIEEDEDILDVLSLIRDSN